MKKFLTALSLLICLSAIKIAAQCPPNQPVYFADADGDGRADAIVVNDDGVTVRRSSGVDFRSNEAWITEAYYGQRGTFFVDVTGDRRADAVVVNDGGVVVRRSLGNRFQGNEAWTDGGYYGQYGTFFADVDGDGRADAIVINDEAVVVRRSSGSNFRPNEVWINSSLEEKRNLNKDNVFFADVDGDRRADLITFNKGLIYVRRSTGRNFRARETWYNDNTGNRKIVVADVTGDGRADIVTLGERNRGNILLISSGTNFTADNEWLNGGARDDSQFGGSRWKNTQLRGDKDTIFADVDNDRRADAILINDNRVDVRLAAQSGFRNMRPWTEIPYYSTSKCLGGSSYTAN